MRRIIAAMLLLMLAACAGPRARPRADGPDSPVTSTPGDPIVNPSPRPLETPRPGLVEPRPSSWDRPELDGPRTVIVTYWGGVDGCYGLDHVEVDETSTRVTITVHEGRVPTAEACIEIAIEKRVAVELAEPLGERTLVDGATGETRDL